MLLFWFKGDNNVDTEFANVDFDLLSALAIKNTMNSKYTNTEIADFYYNNKKKLLLKLCTRKSMFVCLYLFICFYLLILSSPGLLLQHFTVWPHISHQGYTQTFQRELVITKKLISLKCTMRFETQSHQRKTRTYLSCYTPEDREEKHVHASYTTHLRTGRLFF